jgi:serine/threonine-protein kinase
VPILSDGDLVRDVYHVERFLGEGAFAEVFRVRHQFLRRSLAMKVFKAPFESLEVLDERLEEGRTLAALEHPNIVRLHDAGLFNRGPDGYGFFTMEYVAGGSLDTYWRSYREKFMPTSEAVEIVRQACRGLATAHAKQPPIIHRDIKPQNLLIGYDGEGLRVRVSDFGLAKSVNPLTLFASARGTISFKPPEAINNQDSTASDVWALGTVLYVLLSDHLPYPELDARDAGDARRFLRPLRPASIYNITVDNGLDSIVHRCLAIDPQDRYHDATDLLADLERWAPSAGPAQLQPSMSEVGSATSRKDGQEDDSKRLRTAEEMVREAHQLAKNIGQLETAADLLEHAINQSHALRERYAERVTLWRRGIVM